MKAHSACRFEVSFFLQFMCTKSHCYLLSHTSRTGGHDCLQQTVLPPLTLPLLPAEPGAGGGICCICNCPHRCRLLPSVACCHPA